MPIERSQVDGNGAAVAVALREVEKPVTHDQQNAWSANELIAYSKENPPEPIIDGLLCVGDTMLIHGTEESYKSVFVIQIAEAISSGRTLLRHWTIQQSKSVGIIETEMHAAMMGERLQKMYPNGNAPHQMHFMHDEVLKMWRRENMEGKFRVIEDWIYKNGIQVLMIDTANDFFRAENNPSAETIAGEFFDRLRNLRVQARIIVRHDRKRREEDADSNSNERIRGSAEFKEDPEAILFLERVDKRTQQVGIEVGKLRYGRKPEPFTAWFDAKCFRLGPLPPVIATLESGRRTRSQIIAECWERFGLAERTTDDMLTLWQPYLRPGQDGHHRTFELDHDRALEAPWAGFLTHPGP